MYQKIEDFNSDVPGYSTTETNGYPSHVYTCVIFIYISSVVCVGIIFLQFF